MADEDPSCDTVCHQWACTSCEYLGYRICVSRGSENVCGVEAFGSYVNSSDAEGAQGESQHCAECTISYTKYYNVGSFLILFPW